VDGPIILATAYSRLDSNSIPIETDSLVSNMRTSTKLSYGILCLVICLLLQIQSGLCLFDGIMRELARLRAVRLLQIYPDLAAELSQGIQVPGFYQTRSQMP